MVALASCAQPLEGRIATRLYEAGIPRRTSECVAKRWVERLSVFHLRKIQRLTEDLKAERGAGRLTVVGLVQRVDRMNDPETLKVVSASAAVCALKI
jgi:hypothetical protein